MSAAAAPPRASVALPALASWVPPGRLTAMALAIALGSLAVSVALWPSVRIAVPATVVLAGMAGA
jgi:hypothetical protein